MKLHIINNGLNLILQVIIHDETKRYLKNFQKEIHIKPLTK